MDGAAQNIHHKGVRPQNVVSKRVSPGGSPGLDSFSIYIFSIAVGMKLKCHSDIVEFERVTWFWGLTSDFWAENERLFFEAT